MMIVFTVPIILFSLGLRFRKSNECVCRKHKLIEKEIKTLVVLKELNHTRKNTSTFIKQSRHSVADF